MRNSIRVGINLIDNGYLYDSTKINRGTGQIFLKFFFGFMLYQLYDIIYINKTKLISL